MGDFLQGAWRLWERASERVRPQPGVGPTLPNETDFWLCFFCYDFLIQTRYDVFNCACDQTGTRKYNSELISLAPAPAVDN